MRFMILTMISLVAALCAKGGDISQLPDDIFLQLSRHITVEEYKTFFRLTSKRLRALGENNIIRANARRNSYPYSYRLLDGLPRDERLKVCQRFSSYEKRPRLSFFDHGDGLKALGPDGNIHHCDGGRRESPLVKLGPLLAAGGNKHNGLAVTRKGLVYAWGKKNWEWLNILPKQALNRSRYGVALVPELSGERIVAVACSEHHSLALTADGRVFSWGDNRYARLGLGHGDEVGKGINHVEELDGKGIIDICCGDYHSIALASDGRVYAWGKQWPWSETRFCQPTLMDELNDIVAISSSRSHFLALTSLGTLYASGSTLGHLGLETQEGFVQLPNSPKGVVAISCGGGCSFALTIDGKAYKAKINSRGFEQISKSLVLFLTSDELSYAIWIIDGDRCRLECDL